MITPKPLLSALQKRGLLLEVDRRARCNAQPEVDAPLRKDYDAAREKGRTGLTYNAWRDEELTQIAVAWILAGVFVRFLENNELIDVPFLAGGNAARHQRAQDEHSLFFRQHPTASERDYFEHVFNTVGQLPGMKDFFDRRHNSLWRVGPTADAAKALLEFWRKTDPDTGRIIHDFTDPSVSGKSECRMPKPDIKRSPWWKLRGKLDVPKEHWLIYPGAEREGDPSPVIAWAGWDHAQQAQGLAAYCIDASQNRDWASEKLKPLLAGLVDLLPWLKQWHNEFNPDFSSGLGDYFAGFLDEEARKQGTTVEALNRFRTR